MVDVIIAEKPNVAKKIKSIFNNIRAFKYKGVTYFKNNELIIISGVGHIFQLDEKVKTNKYPVFDIEWKPSYIVDKSLKYTQPYIELAQQINNVDRAIIATDFDIEGSLIGYNIARYGLKVNNLYRMKFSSLTYSDLQRAWKEIIDFDYYNAFAGEARHVIDWFYGINLSRFLMSSLKMFNINKVLSIGRVQAPSLALIVDRENSIRSFKPKNLFYLQVEVNDYIFNNNKEFSTKEELDKYLEQLKDFGIVVKKEPVIKTRYVYPPNLMDLQQLAYYNYKISPSVTQKIAQSLYEKGLISYPRTSSRQYPKGLNIRKILEKIKDYDELYKYINNLLNKNDLIPTQGDKTDPAHPAIYPTGELPYELNNIEKQIYDIIIRNFIATLYNPVKIELIDYELNIGDIFKAQSVRIVDKGFLNEIFNYKPYSKISDNIINLESGEYKVKIKTKTRKTRAPERYNEASIIAKLEELKLGTKATRATIIQTLFDRKYIYKNKGKIFLSELGEIIKNVLEPYVPELFKEQFTRQMEEDLESIENLNDMNNVINNAKQELINIFNTLSGKEKEIGEKLSKFFSENRGAGGGI